ncbi:MAG: hypothetical protein KatS3mg039_1060 [Candidatus Kapaibacterium sp.]|nr:MAG: hypothetical protein KatS3mg039_1060 [Candidatus Kapabacteria bacterium]
MPARVVRWWYARSSIGGMQIDVESDDGKRCIFDVDTTTAEQFQLSVGRELSADELARLEQVHTALGFIRRMQRFLAHRLRSSGEVAQRLRTLGATHEHIALALDLLRGNGVINDERFAYAYVRDCVRLGTRSAQAIRRKLVAAGIAPDLADRALTAEYPADLDMQRARSLARKILRHLRNATPEQRYRRIRDRLVRQGFPPETVRSILREMMDSAEHP